MAMGEESKVRKELSELTEEHQDLDSKINGMMQNGVFDQILLQRLKRRKLGIKDRITELRNFLLDDIIA